MSVTAMPYRPNLEANVSETKHTPEQAIVDVPSEATMRLIEAAPDLRDVAEALLLFYTTNWTDERVDRWFALTGSAEATTKALCDFARRALAKAEAR